MLHKLGKRPARHAIQFAFGTYFESSLLWQPPGHFGRYWRFSPDSWGMLGNDAYSDCVWAGAAHETMLWCSEYRRWNEREMPLPEFTPGTVLANYSEQTGFDPGMPDTDQGTDMQEAASFRRKVGILDAAGVRHKIDAYVALRHKNLEQLKQAMFLFGAIGLGVEYPESADRQFDAGEPWAVDKKSEILGGHYVAAVGVKPNGNFALVTFGRCIEATPEFVEYYADEAVAYLSAERLRAQLSPDGFHYDRLQSDLKALGR